MKWEKLWSRICFQGGKRRLQTHSNVLALVVLLRLKGRLSILLLTLGILVLAFVLLLAHVQHLNKPPWKLLFQPQSWCPHSS